MAILGKSISQHRRDLLVCKHGFIVFLLQFFHEKSEELTILARSSLIDVILLTGNLYEIFLCLVNTLNVSADGVIIVHMVLFQIVQADSKEGEAHDLIHLATLGVASAIRTVEFCLALNHTFGAHALLDLSQRLVPVKWDRWAIGLEL